MKLISIMFILNTDTLPPQYLLFESLKQYHRESEYIQTKKYDTKTKNAWLHWLPSVGLQFGKPSISFSLGQAITNIERKAQRQEDKEAIMRQTKINFKVDSFSLVSQLLKYDIYVSGLERLEDTRKVENEIWQLIKDKYQLGKIMPNDYLNAKANYFQKQSLYFQRVEEIEILKIEILKTAKF